MSGGNACCRYGAVLLVFGSLLNNAAGFTNGHVSRVRPLVASSFNYQERFLETSKKDLQIPGQPHKALSYPISGSSSDENRSWEDVISQAPLQPNQDTSTAAEKVLMGGSAGLAVLSLYALLTMAAPGAWRYFLAGGICAATSHAIPTPIDVVKTRKQIDPELADQTFLKAARHITKTEGVKALWAGLGPTAWGYLLEGALKFGIYEVLKPVIKSTLSRFATITTLGFLDSQILGFMVCGTASGFAASLMLCPMEAIRIRMVSEPDFTSGGWLSAGAKMFKQEGMMGLLKGMNPMILKQVPYTVTKNVSFDIFTKFFYSTIKAQGMALTPVLMFTVPFVSAAIASVLSSVTSQPGDMVLSLVNAHQGQRRSREYFQSIMRSERGVGGFFVGFKTRLLHVGMTVTLQLIIYDYVKRLCGIAATGSC